MGVVYQTGFLALTLYIAWQCWIIARRFLFKSPLHNLDGPPSSSILQGVLPQIFNVNAWDFHREISERYGGLIKIKGPLGEDQLYVFDPKAMHHILVEDAHAYEESAFLIEGNNVLFGPGLLGTHGDQHRKQRKMLNPVFSTANMKEMVPTFYRVTHKLRNTLANKVKHGPQEIDILDWSSRTALELIGQCGLGYSFDPLTEDEPDHPYILSVKRLIPAAYKILLPAQFLLTTVNKIGTPNFQRWVIDRVPWKALSDVRDIVDTFYNTSVDILKMKTKMLASGDDTGSEEAGDGKDILSILLKLNEESPEDERLTEAELLGQMSAMTFAATDTTSSSIARTLLLLATHQNIQDKLREEIIESRTRLHEGEDLPYEELTALPYLDAVCRETLRLYSPPSGIMRMSQEDTILPLSTPVKGVDGQDLTEVLVPKNTNIYISILSHNRNRDLWGPDSYEYRPERWLSPLPDRVSDAQIPAVYSHIMTFVGGGRSCIGFRFAILEMKVILSILVESFRFSLSKKEVIWHMTHAIATATVPGSNRSQLPLIVERA